MPQQRPRTWSTQMCTFLIRQSHDTGTEQITLKFARRVAPIPTKLRCGLIRVQPPTPTHRLTACQLGSEIQTLVCGPLPALKTPPLLCTTSRHRTANLGTLFSRFKEATPAEPKLLQSLTTCPHVRTFLASAVPFATLD